MSLHQPLLIYNIGELVTLQPLMEKGLQSPISEAELGIEKSAWLLIQDGKVHALGHGSPPSTAWQGSTIDARGQLVTPGLVDAHTHPIFAGSRAHEFALKLAGTSYQEIAQTGGGIQATVSATREASDEQLLAILKGHIEEFVQMGVTTIEVKSGYGLNVAEELRHLSLIQAMQEMSPALLIPTCLALHAIPPEVPNKDQYVGLICRELLPEVANKGLARFVDIFIETGYFDTSDGDLYAHKARELGLELRVHADEFSDAGAAAFAARWQAASADHLQSASDEGLKLLGQAQVPCILLPGTSLYSRIPYAAGERLRNAGCTIAIASDFNPGSCRIRNLGFIAALAAVQCQLSIPEIIAGITFIPAKSLGVHEYKGHLAPGADADIALWTYASVEEWVADFCQRPPRQVLINGETIVHRLQK